MKFGNFHQVNIEMNEKKEKIKFIGGFKFNLSRNNLIKTKIKIPNLSNKFQKGFLFIRFILVSVLIVICVINFAFYNNKANKSFSSYRTDISFINLYIIAHKDFHNKLNNLNYKILCDNKTQFKNKYQLQILETYKDNELYPKKRGYCEGTKIYYIWKQYIHKKISSKYVGFVHYRRVFYFKNNIPDLDKIFSQYDVIIKRKKKIKKDMKAQYAKYHFLKFIEEIEEIP